MIDRIIDQLNKSRTVLVASHTNPDGDAIGALLATGLALRAMQKEVCMYNESAIPAVYRFLPSVRKIGQNFDAIERYDTILILDCGSLERVGKMASQLKKGQIIINIDHHVTNTKFGNLQWIDPNACATAEIIYRLIKRLGSTFDCPIATAIYTGILTDTGSFRFSSTNQQAFAICAEMIENGANPYEVAQHVYGHYSLGRIKLLNLALDSLEISPNGKVSIMSLTQDMLDTTRTQEEDIDGIINYARRIEDVKVAALIHEVAGYGRARRQYHVSLRSDGDVNVALIAAQFGGGGHANAAGFSVEATLDDLKHKIVELSESTPGLCEMN
ncbi:MAG: bifunctional oligoribonuclease/PAP phosphatase NrnA [Desulfobacteraceae bacterium]